MRLSVNTVFGLAFLFTTALGLDQNKNHARRTNCQAGDVDCKLFTNSTAISQSKVNGSSFDPTSTSSATLLPDATATPAPKPKPEPQTIALKRDWRIDASKVENLAAEKHCKMMYTNPDVEIGNKPSRKTPLAWVTLPEMKYPAIQLYNTDRVSKVQCLGTQANPSKIIMEFKDREAYDWAWNNWHNEVRMADGDYLVITDAPGCWEGVGASQERNFLRATTEERDNRTMSISCDVEPIPLSQTVPKDAINDIEFGEFRPGNTPKGVNVAEDAPDSDGGAETVNAQSPLKDTSGDSDFDWSFDSRIGRMTEESLSQSPLGQAGFTLDDFYGESDLQDLATQNLAKRKIGDRIKKAVKKVGAAIQKAVAVVKEAVVKAAEAIVEAVKVIGEKLNDFFTFDKSFKTNQSFNTITNTNTDVTPFNGVKGIKMLSVEQEVEKNGVTVKGQAELFCVECGIEGNFVIAGALRFSIGQGMEKAEVSLAGSMDAGFSLGLAGSLEVSGELDLKVNKTRVNEAIKNPLKPKPGKRQLFDKRLVSLSLADFLIPGILDIGPIVSLDLGANLGIAAEGKILVGVIFSWPNIDAKIDLTDAGQNKADGFAPTVTPVFEADGEFTITAGAQLEFKMAFGVSILNGRFDLSAGVAVIPSVEITATIAAEADLNGVRLAESSKGCTGLGIGLTTAFDVDFVLFEGLPFEKRNNIKHLDGPGFDECIDLLRKRSISRRQTIPPSFPSPPSTLGNTTMNDGLMTSMSTLDNEFRLRWSPNGNTYAVEEKKVPADAKGKEWSGWFASDETGSLIIGDTHGRIFHGYLDTIQSLGVSRVRLHGPNEIPKSAWPVMFAATIPESRNTSTVALATQNPTMVISDVEGNLYFPVICVYKSERVFPKLFMANSTDDGIPTLMGNSAAVLENVTGEEVQECGFMTWTNFRTGQSINTDDGGA